MKKIFILLMIGISLDCSAQNKQVLDTSFTNNISKNFFHRNPSIKELHFFYNFQLSNSVSVYFKKNKTDSNQLVNDEYYNLNFIGDKYLFEKKYGVINISDKEIQTIKAKKCSPHFYLSCAVNPDSIKLKLVSKCLTDTDDKFFVKVELFGHYKYGMKNLEKEIQLALDKNYFSAKHILTDSVYFFKTIISNNDSCLLQTDLTDGKPSLFTTIIIDELNHLCSWVPSLQGGRSVKTYLKIYVRLNKDQQVTVAYPED